MKLPSTKKSGYEAIRRGAQAPRADMPCDAVWHLLSLYADEEASTDEAQVVETHVSTCVGCARDLAFMSKTQSMFAALPSMAPPDGLRSAIFAATVNKPSTRQLISETIHRLLAPAPARYAFAAAAGIAGLMVAAGIHGGLGNPGGLSEGPVANQLGQHTARAQRPPEAAPAESTNPSAVLPGSAGILHQAPTIVQSIHIAHPGITGDGGGSRLSAPAPTNSFALGPHPAQLAAIKRARPGYMHFTLPKNTVPKVTIASVETKVKAPVVEAKPNATDEGAAHTADMVVMMDPVPMNSAALPMSPTAHPTEGSAAAAAPKLTRFFLTSSSSPDTVGPATSFAELKRALKARDLEGARAIEQSIKAQEIRLPVLRKTF